ncbi:MAG: FUSC family protein [Sulfobacillus sp.]
MLVDMKWRHWRLLTAWRFIRWTTTLQVIKTGLASGLAWALAHSLLNSQRPYFAPLAAILSLQVTVKESVFRGLQRVVGVVAGILVALVAVHFLGISAWSIGLLVLLAMGIATRLQLGTQGIPQVAISALLVMTIGASVPGYALARVLDTILGAMVAIVVNALVIPPDFTDAAEQALTSLADSVSAVLAGIRDDLADGLNPTEANQHLDRAREVDRALSQARHAIRQAEDGLQWNYLVRHRKTRLKRLRQAIMVLDHCVSQVRGIARTLFVTLNRDVTSPYGAFLPPIAEEMISVFDVMGNALGAYAELIRGQDQTAAVKLDALLNSARCHRQQLIETAASLLLHLDAGRFLDIAAVVSDLEKMSEDLNVSAHLLVPLVAVGT